MWATRLFWKLALVYVVVAAALALGFLAVAAPGQLSPGALRGTLAIFAAGQVCLTLGFTYILLRQVVGPVARLTRDARAITAGEETPTVLIDGEVGVLGEAINHMQLELA